MVTRKFGDESFKSKKKAVARRIVLNRSLRGTNVNLVNRVLKTRSGFVVRARTKRRRT